jgi:hypothetical protein
LSPPISFNLSKTIPVLFEQNLLLNHGKEKLFFLSFLLLAVDDVACPPAHNDDTRHHTDRRIASSSVLLLLLCRSNNNRRPQGIVHASSPLVCYIVLSGVAQATSRSIRRWQQRRPIATTTTTAVYPKERDRRRSIL